MSFNCVITVPMTLMILFYKICMLLIRTELHPVLRKVFAIMIAPCLLYYNYIAFNIMSTFSHHEQIQKPWDQPTKCIAKSKTECHERQEIIRTLLRMTSLGLCSPFMSEITRQFCLQLVKIIMWTTQCYAPSFTINREAQASL